MTTIKQQERRNELHRAALDDLTERIMRGEEYPRRADTGMQVNRLGILSGNDCNVDSLEIAEAIEAELRATGDFSDAIEKIVRKALNGSKWHDRRIDEIIEEREEVARTIHEDARREFAEACNE